MSDGPPNGRVKLKLSKSEYELMRSFNVDNDRSQIYFLNDKESTLIFHDLKR